MTIFPLTRFTWQEPAAYSLSILLLVSGGYLSLSYDPDWMGRAGSLIIVCAVLLASSRKFDVLQAQAITFINERAQHEKEEIKKILTTPAGNMPSDEEVDAMVNKILEDSHGVVEEIIDDRRRVFKIHEIILVIVGTLINGFGPWIAKRCLDFL
ncbi:MAG: hypothetical protein JO002_10545 [Burkholderiaceae bacterium]|nr:hypothetical protein [Burkholderiaceae bacterium]